MSRRLESVRAQYRAHYEAVNWPALISAGSGAARCGCGYCYGREIPCAEARRLESRLASLEDSL